MQPEIHATDPPAPASDLLPPQRRKGIPRVTVILGVGLLAAAAFLGGIQAQKQWGDDNSNTGGGFAARLAAANGATGAGAEANGAPGAQGNQDGGAFARGGGGFTTGTVKLVQGSTLYVTTTDGNTVKVSVPATTTITKSVTAKVSAIKPGDTVTAVGTATDGVVKATTVRVGDLGPGGFRRAGGENPGGQPPSTP